MKRSIEQILFLQNFYLSVICIIVFCGTSAPLLFHWLWNRNVGTGAPFYNAVLCPLFTSVFFVLVYAHYIQFKISNPELRLKDVRAKQIKNITSPSLLCTNWRSFLFLYCIFFFFLHVLLGVQLIGLNYLDSVYGAICILLISSILISSQKSPSGLGNETIMASVSSQPSRHITFRVYSEGSPVGAKQLSKTRRPGGHLWVPKRRWPLTRLRDATSDRWLGLKWAYTQTFLSGALAANERSCFATIAANAPSKRASRRSTDTKHLRVRQDARRKLVGPRWVSMPGPAVPQLTALSTPSGAERVGGPLGAPSPDRRLAVAPKGRPKGVRSMQRCVSSDRGDLRTSAPSDAKEHQAVLQEELKLDGAKSERTSHLPRRSRSARIATEDVFRRSPERKSLKELRNRRYATKEGMNVAHTGIVLFIIGILLSNTFKFEFTEQLHSGPLGAKHLGSQLCCLRSIDHSFAPTYHSICANLLIYQQLPFGPLTSLWTAPFAHNLKEYLQLTNSQQVALHERPKVLLWPRRGKEVRHDPLRGTPLASGNKQAPMDPQGRSLAALQGAQPDRPRWPEVSPFPLRASVGIGGEALACKAEGPPGWSAGRIVALRASIGYSGAQRSKEAPLDVFTAVCMFPEKRFYYSTQGTVATKVAIHSNLFTDFYSLIGTGSFETGWFTTIMKLPFIFCIWLGFLFGVLGGLLSLKKQLQKSKLYWL